MSWTGTPWIGVRVEDDVRRLRQRIFTASKAGDLKKVRNLQKLMLRSRANALVSVRRVTEVNAGRKTAGVDGRIVLAGWEKAELAAWLQHGAGRVEAPARQAGVHPEIRTGNGAGSGFRRRRHSAAASSDLLGSLVVTHPFHPLTGQRLEVLVRQAP